MKEGRPPFGYETGINKNGFGDWTDDIFTIEHVKKLKGNYYARKVRMADADLSSRFGFRQGILEERWVETLDGQMASFIDKIEEKLSPQAIEEACRQNIVDFPIPSSRPIDDIISARIQQIVQATNSLVSSMNRYKNYLLARKQEIQTHYQGLLIDYYLWNSDNHKTIDMQEVWDASVDLREALADGLIGLLEDGVEEDDVDFPFKELEDAAGRRLGYTDEDEDEDEDEIGGETKDEQES